MLRFAFGVRVEHQQPTVGQNENGLVDELRPHAHEVLFPELELNAFGDIQDFFAVLQSLSQDGFNLLDQLGLPFDLAFVAKPFDLGKNRRQVPVYVFIQ